MEVRWSEGDSVLASHPVLEGDVRDDLVLRGLTPASGALALPAMRPRWDYRKFLRSDQPGLMSPVIRQLGLLWVCVSVPFITGMAFLVDSPGSYVFVYVFLSCGAYTLPALFAGWYAVRHAPARDKLGYWLLYTGLGLVFAIGLAMLLGLATGWRWGNVLGLPAVFVSGCVHLLGVARLARYRSGRRALSVDILEAIVAAVAATAPLVVLWGPAVLNGRAPWFTLAAALSTLFAIWTTYWGVQLLVRLGPGRGMFETCALGLSVTGIVNAALQTAQGASGFALPVPPLIALNALCFSQYLLIPLNVPLLLRKGLDRLPPQAQVRGSRLAAMVSMVGVAGLLVATAVVAHERPWAVPFALGVVALLCVLGGLRQIAASDETKRLYREVEEAAEERRRLVTQLLERSVHDRRRFAGHLYEQTVSAYTSFRVLAGADGGHRDSLSAMAEASALVGGHLAQQADWARELIMAIRPLDGDRTAGRRLATPIRAYLASLYGDDTPPRLAIEVTDDLVLDWVAETVLLQVVQEALDNVRRHSDARIVRVAIEVTDDGVTLRVSDDGVGFDLTSVPEATGLATMRAAAAVIGGTLVVEAHPGEGTSITACVTPGGPPCRTSAETASADGNGNGNGGTNGHANGTRGNGTGIIAPLPQLRPPGLRLVPRLPDPAG